MIFVIRGGFAITTLQADSTAAALATAAAVDAPVGATLEDVAGAVLATKERGPLVWGCEATWKMVDATPTWDSFGVIEVPEEVG